MKNDESKDQDAAVPSNQYSDKLQSLLSFLEEHCEQNNDSDDKLSSSNGGRETGISPSHSARTGLADITNHNPSTQASRHDASEKKKTLAGQDEKELKDLHDRFDASSDVMRHVMREKKHG